MSDRGKEKNYVNDKSIIIEKIFFYPEHVSYIYVNQLKQIEWKKQKK